MIFLVIQQTLRFTEIGWQLPTLFQYQNGTLKYV